MCCSSFLNSLTFFVDCVLNHTTDRDDTDAFDGGEGFWTDWEHPAFGDLLVVCFVECDLALRMKCRFVIAFLDGTLQVSEPSGFRVFLQVNGVWGTLGYVLDDSIRVLMAVDEVFDVVDVPKLSAGADDGVAVGLESRLNIPVEPLENFGVFCGCIGCIFKKEHRFSRQLRI